MHDFLNDRQQDVCEPLLAIADRVGGDWPQRTRLALIGLYGGVAEEQRDDSLGVTLLADIHLVFQGSGCDRLPTFNLLSELWSLKPPLGPSMIVGNRSQRTACQGF